MKKNLFKIEENLMVYGGLISSFVNSLTIVPVVMIAYYWLSGNLAESLAIINKKNDKAFYLFFFLIVSIKSLVWIFEFYFLAKNIFFNNEEEKI